MVFMPHWPIPYANENIKTDLSKILTLMEALGNPQNSLPPVIHVAGTNGKGSTVAFLKAIFQAANYKVHTYTSPHFLHFNERICLSGQPISDSDLFRITEKVRLVHQNLFPQANGPTFFEITTAIAFLAFVEFEADILILETGMGGRIDATNIVPRPLLTIITPISYDHMNILGNRLSLIAQEKAGIIKENIPCIISAQTDEAMDVIIKTAESKHSPTIAYGYDFAVTKEDDQLILYDHNKTRKFPQPSLLGDHQFLNAATVIKACDMLQDLYNITDDHITDGLRSVNWPGRLQMVSWKNHKIFLDGAHNQGGAQVLALWAKENMNQKISLILGMTKNRNVMDFIQYFSDIVDTVYCVNVKSEPSSYSSERLSALLSPSGIKTVGVEFLDDALNLAIENSKHVIITGSLFLIADAYKLISGIT